MRIRGNIGWKFQKPKMSSISSLGRFLGFLTTGRAFFSSGSGANTTDTLGGGGSTSGSIDFTVEPVSTAASNGVTTGTVGRRSREGGVDAGFCKNRVMALLQTNVRSAILRVCALNLAEIAQNVSSNGAKAADCRQRRKCSNAFIRRFEVSSHNAWHSCKRLVTFANDLSSGQ